MCFLPKKMSNKIYIKKWTMAKKRIEAVASKLRESM